MCINAAFFFRKVPESCVCAIAGHSWGLGRGWCWAEPVGSPLPQGHGERRRDNGGVAVSQHHLVLQPLL